LAWCTRSKSVFHLLSSGLLSDLGLPASMMERRSLFRHAPPRRGSRADKIIVFPLTYGRQPALIEARSQPSGPHRESSSRSMRVSARSISRCVAVLVVLTLFCPLVLAQPRPPFQQPGQRPGQPFQPVQPMSPGQNGPSDADVATACGGMAVIFVIIAVISIISTIVWIFVLIWVAKDANARGMDNSVLWVVLVFFLGVIGLVIYLVVRPAGTLKTCRECGKKRLREAKRCPHCRLA
jgi:hypothetical protein